MAVGVRTQVAPLVKEASERILLARLQESLLEDAFI